MTGVRIAAATRRLNQPFRKALHIAATLGVDGVQINARDELRPADITDTAVRHVRKLLDDASLAVSGGVFPTRRGLLDPQNAERRLAALTAAMAMVARLGGRTLITNLGSLPEAETPKQTQAIQILQLAAAAGQRQGVTPVLETSGEPAREVADLLSRLPEGATGVVLDPAELIRHDQSPGAWLDVLGPQVAVMAATDAARGFGSAKTLSVELGRGVADVDVLLARLWEQYQYRGWVVVGRADSPRPAEEIADAASYVRACGH